ncbi:MAG: DegT/DnrJ/EryC1/StrS family aminotransferase [Acetobacter peroxydans]|jgi:dTDP-4-amino-4,6-dideoxygalactose transaminase|nr:DegT/DnrJ/EryC1/StrS family aminotransferase [Acetobacter peroxydans]
MAEVWDAQWLTNGGPKHVALEAALGAHLDAGNLSLFNNGTIALITACQALRLSGEVITTPFTFAATPHVLSWNNITPVFADIDPVTMNLDPRNIEPLITNRTSAILAVHVFGTPCDVEGIQAIADRNGLKVIYDGAHAFGTTVGGESVTCFGDATMLSFHATKLFHTAEGGALVVRNSEIKKRVDFLKNFGIQDETTVLMPGINGKMSELHAALGLLTLDMVADERKRRQTIADIYRERLGDRTELVMPPILEGVTVSQQYFAIRVRNGESRISRDYLFDKLRQYNVYARKYFYPLCSSYSCYRMLPSAQSQFLPVAHQVSEEILCLPFYGGLSADDVHHICDIITFILAA